MSVKIGVNFISRKTGRLIASTPAATKLHYNSDLTQFTDAFDFELDLARGEEFPVRSHDIVEFYFDLPSGRHQLGVGFIEQFHRRSTAQGINFSANGRDLFGQFMLVPFSKSFIHKNLRITQFAEEMVKGSYLSAYLDARNPGLKKVLDKGAFGSQMSFVTDLNQKKGQVADEYAELAINIINQNRLGQVEIIGRGRASSRVGILCKGLGGGERVQEFVVQQDYSQVYSEFTVFYVSGEAILDQNNFTSRTFKNTDQRVLGRIINPGFKTFQTTDLVTLAGERSLTQRVEDIAKSAIRRSNRALNTVIAVVDNPYYTDPTTAKVTPYEHGQKFLLRSNEREFTSPKEPDGTAEVEMLLTAIDYAEDQSAQRFQLRFIEEDSLL